MKHYGLLEVGRMFNRTRDQMDGYIRKSGCPDASIKAGNRRVFTDDDVATIRRWFQATGRRIPETAREAAHA